MPADYSAIYKELGLTSDSDRACALQKSVIAEEREQLADGHAQYSKEHAAQAVVHSRQDLILVVSHLADLNRKQTKLIRRMNVAIALLAIIVLVLVLR